MTAPTAPSWFVVVPVRGRLEDKSRLQPQWGGQTPLLAAAMARDTVHACLRAVGTGRVVVVTLDSAWLGSLRADVHLAADPGAGLDEAARAGSSAARRLDPRCAVAVILGDHPALRSSELQDALLLAGAHHHGVVADDAGTGTALLTAAPGMPLQPSFGEDSAARHVTGGHILLHGPWPGLRLDVDDVDALGRAERLGVGEHTAQVLRTTGRTATG